MEASWLIAVLLAAMASFISNLGVTLQKLHHLRSASDPRNHSAEYHKGWMWRVGLGLVFFGSLADFAALSFGPQSLVAPLGSLTLVSNVIFAPLLLKETIGHWDVLATVLIVVGSSVAVMFGSHESVTFTCDQLFSFFTRWDFSIYAFLISAYGLVLYLFIQKIEVIEKEDGIHSPRYLHYRGLHRFAYPSLSGTVGAQSVLFAKAFVSLLSNTVQHWSASEELVHTSVSLPIDQHAVDPLLIQLHTGPIDGTTNWTDALPPEVPAMPAPTIIYHPSQNMFVHWQTYFIFAAMLGAIFAQIKYLNEGLKRFDASYAVPVFTSFWIILSVLSGMIFYQEYTGMDTGQCLFFAFGVLVTVTGVITLGGREQTHHGHAPLPQVEVDEEDPLDGALSAHDRIGHDGSINPVGGAQHESIHKHSTRIVTSHHHQHVAHGDHDDAGDLEPDLDDIHISPSSLSHHSSSSTHPSSHHTHIHHPSVRTIRSSSMDENEGSVSEGAKTAVLEASQRIQQAFQKLRGKGQTVGQGERDAINSIQSAIDGNSSSNPSSSHLPSSSSSSSSRSIVVDETDEQSDFASEVTDDEDPLILKGAAAKSKSKSKQFRAQARKSPAHSNSTVNSINSPSGSMSNNHTFDFSSHPSNHTRSHHSLSLDTGLDDHHARQHPHNPASVPHQSSSSKFLYDSAPTSPVSPFTRQRSEPNLRNEKERRD